MNSQFIDKALLVFKGENYINKVNELGLINKEKHESILKIMNAFISSRNEGYQRDVEELSMLAAVFTPTFYHLNTFQIDVLKDIKFYSENLTRVLLYLFNDSVNELTPFLECSEGLKTHDIDSVYKELQGLSTDKPEHEIVMLKGKLFYSLVITIIENNNSREYQPIKEEE